MNFVISLYSKYPQETWGWIDHFNALGKKLSREEITDSLHGIYFLMAQHDLTILNQLLNNLNPKSSPDQIICLLRSTCMFKEDLPAWKKVVSEAPNWLQAQNLNPQEILKGLI